MEKIVIEGKTRLKGEVTISGAKNAAVAILPATILMNGICKLENVPDISDVQMTCKILEKVRSKNNKNSTKYFGNRFKKYRRFRSTIRFN